MEKRVLFLVFLMLIPFLFPAMQPSHLVCYVIYWTEQQKDKINLYAGIVCGNNSRNVMKGHDFFVKELGSLMYEEPPYLNFTNVSSLRFFNGSIFSLRNVPLYIYYYEFTDDPDQPSQKVEIPGCNPIMTTQEKEILIPESYDKTNKKIKTKKMKIYYGMCPVGKAIYASSGAKIYIDFPGVTLKEGETSGNSISIFLFQDDSGVLKDMSSILAAHLTPSSPPCFITLLILGLLLASMYYSGLNPAMLFDISIPYLPSAPGITFSGKTLGVSGRRAAKEYARQREKAEGVILAWINTKFGKLPSLLEKVNASPSDKKALLDFIRRDVLGNKNISPVKKAVLLAYVCEMLRAGVLPRAAGMSSILNTDDRKLLNQVYYGRIGPALIGGRIKDEFTKGLRDSLGHTVPNPLFGAMQGYVWASMLSGFKGRAAGNLSKWPIIGKFLDKGLATVTGLKFVISPWAAWINSIRDVVYGLRVSAEGVKYTLSYPVRWGLKGLGLYTGRGGFLQRWAALTDEEQIELGHWFDLNGAVSRTYNDMREALYEDIVMNVLWWYVRRQAIEALYRRFRKKGLSQNVAMERARREFRRIIMSVSDVRSILVDPDRLIRLFEGIRIDPRFIRIVSNSYSSWREKAVQLTQRASESGWLSGTELHTLSEVFRTLREIDRMNGSDLDRLNALRRYLEERWDLRGTGFNFVNAFAEGNMVITAGREEFIFKRQGFVASDGYYLVGALKETIRQWAYLGLMQDLKKEGRMDITWGTYPSPMQFTFTDALKLFYLKLKVMWLGWGDWYRNEMISIPEPGEGRISRFIKKMTGRGKVSLAYAFFSDGGIRSKEEVDRIVDRIENRTEQYFRDLLSQEGRNAVDRGTYSLRQLLYNPHLGEYSYLEETAPDPRYWRANMNFLWPVGGNAAPCDRYSLLWQAAALKTKRFQPIDRPLEHMMEELFRHRFVNLLAGSELVNLPIDPALVNKYPIIKSFHLPDAYGSFLERTTWYNYVYEGYCRYFGLDKDDPNTYNRIAQLTDKPFTYADLTNKRMPIIHLHDMSYVPYVKGMAVSDWDYIKNGVVTVKTSKGWKAVKIDKLFREGEKILKDLKKNDPKLYQDIEFVEALISQSSGIPSEDTIKNAESVLKKKLSSFGWMQVESTFKELKGLYNELKQCQDTQEFDAKVAQIKQLIISLIGDSSRNIQGVLDTLIVSDNLKKDISSLLTFPQRKLTDEEFNHVLNLIRNERIPVEARVMLLTQFAHATKEWYKLWREADFIRIEPLHKPPEDSRWFTKAGIKAQEFIGKGIEKWIYGISRAVSIPLAEEVALSELFRSRTHELSMRMRTPQSVFDSSNYVTVDYDLSGYVQAWREWAESWSKFMSAWGLYITRDPRGSSTQYGREWYMAAMYHRGPSMPPPLHKLEAGYYGGEDSLYYKAKLFSYKMLTPAWYLNSWLIRGIRNFQTGMYEWPSLHDINLGPEMNLDLMKTYVDVKRPLPHVIRSLFHPGEIIGGRFSRLFRFKDAQHTERGGVPVLNGVWEAPEHFMPATGGVWFRRHTDAANPGLSRVDAFGQSRLDPRIATYLTRESEYRDFFREDYYVRRLAQFSGVHRGISAEAKLFSFQREMEGYGPSVNYLWSFISPAFLFYYGYRSSQRGQVPFVGWIYERMKGAVTSVRDFVTNPSQSTERVKRWTWDRALSFRAGICLCPRCGARMRRGERCPNCGYFVHWW